MEKKKYIVAEFIWITGVCISLLLVAFKNNIWFDESFTLNLVNNSWEEVIRLTSLDVHPPLYYVVFKFFVELLGWNHIAVYATSVLCFVALLIISCWFFAKYFSHKTALLMLVILCAAPNMLKYALQLRMYSMSVLFVTSAWYMAYILCLKIKQEGFRWNRYWFLLAVINVLAAYTHYFAGVAAVAISLWVLIYVICIKKDNKRKGIVRWCIYCGLMFVLYLPWIPILFEQMSEVNKEYWIGPITSGDLLAYVKMIFAVQNAKISFLLIAVYLVGFILLLVQFKKKREGILIWGCYVVAALWFLFGIGYSVLRNPILVDRYIVIIQPLFWIPIGVACAKVIRKEIYILMILFFIICSDYNYQRVHEEYVSSFQNELIPYMKEHVTDEDVFFHLYVQDMSIGKAYFPTAEHFAFNWIGNGQVFHYWEELVDCHLIEEVGEMKNIEGDIWCFNGDYVHLFETEGWTVETVQLTAGKIYRIYHH